MRKVLGTYLLLVMWLVAIPLTAVYAAVIGAVFFTNPVDLFLDVSREIDLDTAWDWEAVRRLYR